MITQIPKSPKESPKAAKSVQPIQRPKIVANTVSSSPTKATESSGVSQTGRPVSAESLDVLERARTAIAAANRASAAARAAAELVNVNFNSLTLESNS